MREDARLVREILTQIDEALGKILHRFTAVDSIDFFLDTPEGEEKLDSICMLLIAVGESLKKIDKLTEHKLLVRYPQVDWKAVKGMRDILSHHYFDLNAEAVYHTCLHDVPLLQETIQMILREYKGRV